MPGMQLGCGRYFLLSLKNIVIAVFHRHEQLHAGTLEIVGDAFDIHVCAQLAVSLSILNVRCCRSQS